MRDSLVGCAALHPQHSWNIYFSPCRDTTGRLFVFLVMPSKNHAGPVKIRDNRAFSLQTDSELFTCVVSSTRKFQANFQV